MILFVGTCLCKLRPTHSVCAVKIKVTYSTMGSRTSSFCFVDLYSSGMTKMCLVDCMKSEL